MKVSVFGLGYVGAVSAGCLARSGHQVLGVDNQPAKVEHINAGESPILEEGISELIAEVVASGRLRATCDPVEALRATDLSIVCVGTPSAPNGKLDLSHLAAVCQEIGASLASKMTPHTVIVRSTVLPGTVEEQVLPILESTSGRPHGRGYRVLYNPEFLREGTSIADFFQPPLTLVGTVDGGGAEVVRELYRDLDAPFEVVPARAAEMFKYACNSFHALKISFANEIGKLAKRLGADSHLVMDLVCRDTKLNISRAYLRPGFAFGGSCLPKDLRALTYRAKELDLPVPLLASILPSNESQIDAALEIIRASGRRRVGLLGLSFKAGTDDLRESPLLTLAERLLGKGYELLIHDPLVSLDRLVGANKTYVLREIPHLSRLLVPTLAKVLEFGELVVVGNASREFRVLQEHKFRQDQVVVDLAGLLKEKRPQGLAYHGINW